MVSFVPWREWVGTTLLLLFICTVGESRRLGEYYAEQTNMEQTFDQGLAPNVATQDYASSAAQNIDQTVLEPRINEQQNAQQNNQPNNFEQNMETSVQPANIEQQNVQQNIQPNFEQSVGQSVQPKIEPLYETNIQPTSFEQQSVQQSIQPNFEQSMGESVQPKVEPNFETSIQQENIEQQNAKEIIQPNLEQSMGQSLQNKVEPNYGTNVQPAIMEQQSEQQSIQPNFEQNMGQDLQQPNVEQYSETDIQPTNIQPTNIEPQSPQQDLAPKIEQSSEQKFRILALGTSHTYGGTLEDRGQEAYPKLLSKDATNLALRANGPDYPRYCLESMVGEDAIYDVVILEYYQLASEGLYDLAQRVRARYPHATIIFFKLWYPLFLRRASDGVEFRQWITQNYGDLPLHSQEMKDAMLSTKPEDWIYGQHEEADKAVFEAADAVDGYIDMLPRHQDPRMGIVEQADWFAGDFHHLSKIGHQQVARLIQEIIDSVAKRSDNVGTWGGGDKCITWFEDGNCPISHDQQLEVNQFGRGKFALQVPLGGGRFQVTNTLSTERALYVTHMARGPAPSDYPLTRVLVDSVSVHTDVMLDPTNYLETGSHPLHITRTSKVATVPPGETVTLSVFPLEETGNPLRITGVGFSDDY